MSLVELSVANVRSIEAAELKIPKGLTLIWGDNGSGKTSLLEAIFLLGRGRSFRTRNSERLIRRGQDHLRVIGRLIAPRAYRPDRLRSYADRCNCPHRRPGGGIPGRTVAGVCRAGDRARRAQARRGGRAPPAPLDGLGRVPRGTTVRGHLGALHPRAQAAQCGTADPAGCGPCLGCRAGPSGRADRRVAAPVRRAAATLLARGRRRPERTGCAAPLRPRLERGDRHCWSPWSPRACETRRGT